MSGEAPATKAAAPVEKAAKGLSPVQEVDAVVVSGFEGSDSGAKLARGAQLGGLLVGAEDWFGTFKGRTLLSRLRAQSAAGGRIPPLIVGVQEGGIYRAYPGLPPALGQREIAATNDPAEAIEWAAGTGPRAGEGRVRPQPGADRRRRHARQRRSPTAPSATTPSWSRR